MNQRLKKNAEQEKSVKKIENVKMKTSLTTN